MLHSVTDLRPCLVSFPVNLLLLVVVIQNFRRWSPMLSDVLWLAALSHFLHTLLAITSSFWLLHWCLLADRYDSSAEVMSQWLLDHLGPYPSGHWINGWIWEKGFGGRCYLKYNWLLLWLNLNPLVWTTCVEKKHFLFWLVLVLVKNVCPFW